MPSGDDGPSESNGSTEGDGPPGSDNSPESDGSPGEDGPSDETVVETAAEAAEGVVFSRFDKSAVKDLDVTVSFEDGVLEVDVYLNAPEGRGDADQVAHDAALAARAAVDDLFSAA